MMDFVAVGDAALGAGTRKWRIPVSHEVGARRRAVGQIAALGGHEDSDVLLGVYSAGSRADIALSRRE
jgi:hypothetical protein